MSISAMKYALDVLDNYVEDPRCETERVAAVNLLRQAIAEDKWEPQIEHRYSPNGDLISITIKRTPDGEREQIHPPKRDKHEPVAWREAVGTVTRYYDYNEDGRGEPLYAAPQPDLARVGEVGVWGEWVGLTDEEVEAIYDQEGHADVVLLTQAKLKEKNA